MTANTVTTLVFLLSKHLGKRRTRAVVSDLLHLLDVIPLDEDRIRHALASGWSDFEDAVQAACAEAAGADYVVTRDKRGFRKSAVRPVTPGELLAIL